MLEPTNAHDSMLILEESIASIIPIAIACGKASGRRYARAAPHVQQSADAD